jgi:PAS domain S-box-containing protein
MSLRIKTLLLMGTTLAALTLILFALSTHSLTRGFTLLEQTRLRLQVERARNQFQQDTDDLAFKAEKLARTDELFAYVKNPGPQPAPMFDPETFEKLRIDFAALYTQAGERLFAIGYDSDTKTVVEPPADFGPSIDNLAPLLQHVNPESSFTGTLLLRHKPGLISSRPVLTSHGDGPIKATLIIGRLLDAKALRRIAESTQHPVTLKRCDALNAEEDKIVQSLLAQEASPQEVIQDQADVISGCTLLKDVYGAPAVLMRIDIITDIDREGRSSIWFLNISLLVIGLIFGAVALIALEKMVLAPLTQLSSTVSSIAASGDLSSRVNLHGTDELAILGVEIDRLLASGQQAQRKLLENEAELRQSEERYRRLVETSPDGILVHRDGNILFINTKGVEMFGAKSAGEVLGMNFLTMLEPGSTTRHANLLARLSSGAEFQGTEQQIKRLDGILLDCEVAGTSCMYENKPAGLVVVRDTTERKRAEQDRARIERLAASRQRLAVLGEFAAGVAHEIRNPLHGVNNCVEMLRPKDNVNPADQELWDLAEEGLRRMDLISGRMLQLTRDGQSARVPTDPATLIEESLAFVRARAQKEQIHLKSEIEPNLPQIVIDPVRISEALLNLLVNALDACNKNGTVTVSARMKPETPGMVEIAVADTGAGIPPDIQAKVFDPFFTTKPMGKGSGLGLAITRGIVETHGGVVELISSVNAGTTMKLCLPINTMGSRLDLEAVIKI